MFQLLFFVEFAFLFFLARYLIKSLSTLFFRITKNEKVTIAILACFFFPGTVVHELAHLLTAGLLFVKTGDMQLTPKIMEDGVRLGSVEIENTDLLRRAIIGVAPIIIGMTIIFGALFYLQSLAYASVIIYVIVLFIVFEVSNTLFSSKKDLEGTLEVLATSSVLIAAILVIRPEILRDFLIVFQKKEIVNFFRNADSFLLFPLIIDLALIGIMKLLVGRRH